MKHLVTAIAILIILLSGHITRAQVTFREVRRTNPITRELYVFPTVILPDNPNASTKINNLIREDLLDAPPGTPDRKIFNEVWQRKDHYATMRIASYKTYRNRNGILTLAIEGEGCGAYCQGFERRFTFDLSTGNLLTIDSFFSTAALAVFYDSVNSWRRVAIEDQLVLAKDSLNRAEMRGDSENAEYYTKQIDLYTRCMNMFPIEVYDFYVAETKPEITIFTDRCAGHAEWAVDELNDFETTIDLKDWQQHLSHWGRKLLND